jgi:hypothetical protein
MFNESASAGRRLRSPECSIRQLSVCTTSFSRALREIPGSSWKLVAFAIDYEKERRGPIQWAASILRGIDRDGVDFPPLQKSGTSSVPNLERLDIVTVDRDNVVRLTARGRVMHDAYASKTTGCESLFFERLNRADPGAAVSRSVTLGVSRAQRWRPRGVAPPDC